MRIRPVKSMQTACMLIAAHIPIRSYRYTVIMCSITHRKCTKVLHAQSSESHSAFVFGTKCTKEDYHIFYTGGSTA
jgi:hypothetical protein